MVWWKFKYGMVCLAPGMVWCGGDLGIVWCGGAPSMLWCGGDLCIVWCCGAHGVCYGLVPLQV